MVRRAEDWRWACLYRWLQNTEPDPKLLALWPINRSPNWLARVNESLTNHEVEAIQHSIKRSKPYGAAWFTGKGYVFGLTDEEQGKGPPTPYPVIEIDERTEAPKG